MTPETEKRIMDLVEWLIKESSLGTIKAHYALAQWLLERII